MKLKTIEGNDLYALSFLETCHREVVTVDANAVQLPQLMRQQVSESLTAYRDTFSLLQKAREHVQGLNAQKRVQENELRKLLRHVFQNVRRKLNHPQMTAATLNHFGLNADGKLGQNQSRLRKPTQLALVVLEANRAAADYGFDFLQDPSAASIEAAIYQLDDCYQQVHMALAEERRIFERMQDLRYEARTLQMMVCGYIKARLRGRDATFKRNVLRAFGFEYYTSRAADADADIDFDLAAEADDGDAEADDALFDTEVFVADEADADEVAFGADEALLEAADSDAEEALFEAADFDVEDALADDASADDADAFTDLALADDDADLIAA